MVQKDHSKMPVISGILCWLTYINKDVKYIVQDFTCTLGFSADGNIHFHFSAFIPSQGKAMPKNAQTIAQLLSFHMLVSLFSISFKLGFISMWTKNFQMYKLGFKKVEEPKIWLPASVGS